ncbi:MAG: PAS domain-containing protein [Opitutae bacterium]|nr:PAS domain-containing protein [Opitutae bacterium]
MKPSPVVLCDEPRAFAADEIFFSTTDGRGVITSGNEVFVRISGYDTGELLGRAHNIIRHPDMPRAAFRLVWGYLRAGKPVAALVKNRAKDGRHYWVVALIVPTADGAFLSVRFKPTGPLRAVAAELYAQMLAEERRVRAAGAGEDAAMDAGERVLLAGLRAAGYADYDTFMRVMLCEELKSRDATLAVEGRTILRPLPDTAESTPRRPALAARLAALYGEGSRAYGHLNQLFHRLDDFVALHHALEKKSAFVNNLTGELRLAAMNVALASSRLGSEGLGLGVISQYMGGASGEIAGAVHQLVGGIATVSARLRAVIFNLAAARLQIEMVMAFMHELLTAADTGDAGPSRHQLIHTLHTAFNSTLSRASHALHELESNTHGLNATSHSLGRQMIGLQVAQLGGRVESARLVRQDGFEAVFANIRRQIDSTHQELGELSDALDQLESLAEETPDIAREIETAASRMEAGIGALATA